MPIKVRGQTLIHPVNPFSSHLKLKATNFYRPHPKDGEGNVFTLSTPGGGGGVRSSWGGSVQPGGGGVSPGGGGQVQVGGGGGQVQPGGGGQHLAPSCGRYALRSRRRTFLFQFFNNLVTQTEMSPEHTLTPIQTLTSHFALLPAVFHWIFPYFVFFASQREN